MMKVQDAQYIGRAFLEIVEEGKNKKENGKNTRVRRLNMRLNQRLEVRGWYSLLAKLFGQAAASLLARAFQTTQLVEKTPDKKTSDLSELAN